MARYWLALYRPVGYDPSAESESMAREIDAVNEAMVAAGVRVFVGGLRPPEETVAYRLNSEGEAIREAGPLDSSRDTVGGFWVIDCPDLPTAAKWGRRAALACRGAVEVRPFHG